MKFSINNLIRSELIGLKVGIAKSTHAGYVDIKGIVIDETKNTFLILSQGKKKRVPKKNCVFRFYLPNGMKAEVNGNLLLGKPEERIKKVLKRKW